MPPFIIQQFNLDIGQMTEELLKAIPPGAQTTLSDALKQKGYHMAISNEWASGVPKSVLVGAEFGRDHKGDFYEQANALHLPYVSGPFYTTEKAFPRE